MINKITIKQFFFVSAVCLVVGCSSAPDELDTELILKTQGAQGLYQQAKVKMQQGNYTAATETLSALDSRFPFGPLSHQIQLDLIYGYYKSGQTDEGLAIIDRCICVA